MVRNAPKSVDPVHQVSKFAFINTVSFHVMTSSSRIPAMCRTGAGKGTFSKELSHAIWGFILDVSAKVFMLFKIWLILNFDVFHRQLIHNSYIDHVRWTIFVLLLCELKQLILWFCCYCREITRTNSIYPNITTHTCIIAIQIFCFTWYYGSYKGLSTVLCLTHDSRGLVLTQLSLAKKEWRQACKECIRQNFSIEKFLLDNIPLMSNQDWFW